MGNSFYYKKGNVEITGFNSNKTGELTITATYKSLKTTFIVKITAKTISDVENSLKKNFSYDEANGYFTVGEKQYGEDYNSQQDFIAEFNEEYAAIFASMNKAEKEAEENGESFDEMDWLKINYPTIAKLFEAMEGVYAVYSAEYEVKNYEEGETFKKEDVKNCKILKNEVELAESEYEVVDIYLKDSDGNSIGNSPLEEGEYSLYISIKIGDRTVLVYAGQISVTPPVE